mgnify:CR=1 FL=1
MDPLWMAVSPGASATRVLATDGSETILKARLSRAPSHPRALQWMLEAVALWQGRHVHAVLCAPRSGDRSHVPLYPEWFDDFGGALYSLEWIPHEAPQRPRDAVGAMGEFRDLKQLRIWDALERGGR